MSLPTEDEEALEAQPEPQDPSARVPEDPSHDEPDDELDDELDELDVLPPALRRAFADRGFTSLTQVQRAVLDPSLEGHDLRISSQTGSGKTVAIGLVLAPGLAELSATRPSVLPPPPEHDGRAFMAGPREAGPRAKGPRALILAPTRELARQLEEELSWLFHHLRVRVAVIVGGASYRVEHRALAGNPEIIVGTPGRLLDHLGRGSFDPSSVESLVLDEADQMLDLGFADELDAILARLPDERRTHLVSATFANDVLRLAERIQRSPLAVEGTRLGAANEDIDHVVHLVDPHQRLDALVNLLLAHPDAHTLVFTRTRAGAQEIAEHLHGSGFRVAHLSGELAQRDRVRTLEAFKDGSVRILVATDVAARGIDVSDISVVVHVDAPTSPDAYTHRSGRTGRAGRRGTSLVLAAARELGTVSRVLSRARVSFRIEPLPSARSLEQALDARAIATLCAADHEASERATRIAAALPEETDLRALIARLLDRFKDVIGPSPREVRVVPPPTSRGPRDARGPIAPRSEGPRMAPEDIVPFVVTWGGRHGADPRRVLAMVCRRGDVTRRELGGIHVFPEHTVVEVARAAADHFFQHASRPDPRDPRVRIEPFRGAPEGDRRGGVRPAPRRPPRDGFDAPRPRQSAPKSGPRRPRGDEPRDGSRPPRRTR